MLEINLGRCQQSPFPTHQIQYLSQSLKKNKTKKNSDLPIDLWNVFIVLPPRKITLPELDSRNFEVYKNGIYNI